MKTIVYLFMLLWALLASCENVDEPANATDDCFLVVNVEDLCGQAILQIRNTKYNHLGADWHGLDNVFLAIFTCTDIPSPNTEFYVQLVSPKTTSMCDRCDALLTSDPPSKKYIVKLVDPCPQPTF
jgi:hypothetical protein